ncbi:MAG: hypothetical protein AAF915_13985 [Cyanobacteria bacterium P01_D01_bin.50]
MTSQQQIRVVVPKSVAPIALELVHSLGLSDLSNLFGILITRYAQHLRSTWVLPTMAYPIGQHVMQTVAPSQQHFQPVMMQQSTAVQVSANNSQAQVEPQPQPQMAYQEPQIFDPVIERMAKLVEEF